MKNTLSRSERKRRLKRLQGIVSDFFSFSEDELRKLPCSEEIREELVAGRSLKGGARKRQVKYVTKLLEQGEREKLIQYVDKKRGTTLQKNEDFHELEYLRDSLLDEALVQAKESQRTGTEWEPNWSGSSLDEIEELLPEIDVDQVKKLAWLFVQSRNLRYTRELFRLLRSAKEQQSYSKK